MKMTVKTERALRSSIAHWIRMRDGKTKNWEKPYSDDCPLCDLFIDNDCRGCPVFEKTGKTECSDTPYRAANFAYRMRGINSEEFKMGADKEIKFLKSLLPKKAAVKRKARFGKKS